MKCTGAGSLGDNFLPNLTINKSKSKLTQELMINPHPPMQNNKSFKAPYTRVVQKYSSSWDGILLQILIYSTQLHLMLYLPLDLTPRAVFSIQHSQWCFNLVYHKSSLRMYVLLNRSTVVCGAAPISLVLSD